MSSNEDSTSFKVERKTVSRTSVKNGEDENVYISIYIYIILFLNIILYIVYLTLMLIHIYQ